MRLEKDTSHVMEKEHTAYVMNQGAEFRGRREGRMENGVKNLKGARLFSKTFANHGFGNAYTHNSFFL